MMVMESGNKVNYIRLEYTIPTFTVDVLILVISIEITTMGKLCP